MNVRVAVFLSAVAFVPVANADEPRTISLDGILRANQIVGHLGEPLGTVLRVRGRVRCSPVPDLEKPHPKGGTQRFVMVSHVNGRPVSKNVELRLYPDDLRHRTHGDQIDVRGFERVMTLGVPRGLPTPKVQARRNDLEFHLSCYLDIVSEYTELVSASP